MNELNVLYATVQDRKENPEQGSYTSYLFDRGIDKILKKLGEENTEVIIASLMQSKEDLVNEIGDLLYHLIVLMVEKDIALEEVEAELKKRSKKSHNLKPERRPIESL